MEWLRVIGALVVVGSCGYVLWESRRLSLLSMLSLCYLLPVRRRRRWWLFYLFAYLMIGGYGIVMGLWVVFEALRS